MMFHPTQGRSNDPQRLASSDMQPDPGIPSQPLLRSNLVRARRHLSYRGKSYGPSTMIFHPDPHFEHELKTETGGVTLRTIHGSDAPVPIYDGRFNLTERKKLEEETTEY